MEVLWDAQAHPCVAHPRRPWLEKPTKLPLPLTDYYQYYFSREGVEDQEKDQK